MAWEKAEKFFTDLQWVLSSWQGFCALAFPLWFPWLGHYAWKHVDPIFSEKQIILWSGIDHGMLLEWWNTTKSFYNIWQCFHVYMMRRLKLKIQAFLDFRSFHFRNFRFNAVYISILFSSPLVLCKDLSETKMTKLGVGHITSISGRFSANYINSIHKPEVLAVILMLTIY